MFFIEHNPYLSIFIGILFFYLWLTFAMYKMQRSLMYHPDNTIPSLSEYGLAESAKTVHIQSHDGLSLLSWYLPPKDNRKPLIVFFHGNAGHIGQRADQLRLFRDSGYGFLIPSYRYNAMAGGRPAEEFLLRDAQSIMNWTINQGHETENVILYGESLGSGIAISLAQNHVTRSIILEAPYSSIADVAAARFWFLPVRLLLKDQFESSEYIGNLMQSILILHGARDKTIPLEFAQKLYEAADPQKTELIIYPDAGHTDLYDHGAMQDVKRFIDKQSSLSGI